MAEHKDIADPNRHEPKGADSASEGTAYISDGAGSGEWKFPELPGQSLASAGDFPRLNGVGSYNWESLQEIFSGASVDRLLTASSVALLQGPAALDTPHNIEFGPAQNGPSDPVQIDATGLITFNQGGVYVIKAALQYGRTGGAGVAKLFFRVLVNGVQVGRSIATNISSADVVIPFSDESWVKFNTGDTVRYQFYRDSTGNNSGSLVGFNPTIGWGFSPGAYLRVERFV